MSDKKREAPDVAPAARKSVPPWRDGYRRREPDLSAREDVAAVVAFCPEGLPRSLVLRLLVVLSEREPRT
jgi:hypothetical protein